MREEKILLQQADLALPTQHFANYTNLGGCMPATFAATKHHNSKDEEMVELPEKHNSQEPDFVQHLCRPQNFRKWKPVTENFERERVNKMNHSPRVTPTEDNTIFGECQVVRVATNYRLDRGPCEY